MEVEYSNTLSDWKYVDHLKPHLWRNG
jgi:hypothetical protein